MGLGSSIVSKVLTRYKADTSEASRAVKKLRGEQKKAAKASLEELEAQNKGIDDQIAKWGKVAAGIGAAFVAIKGLQSGFAAYRRNAQLTLAAAGEDIDALQMSTRGLVDEQRLLELAAANANTQFKLNSEELNVVAKAAITLRNQGNDLGDTLDRLQKAVVEGSTEPLKELGITIDAASGKAETLQQVIARLREENEGAAAGADLATDAIDRQAVVIQDAFREIRISLGKLAVALAPVVKAFGKLAGFLAEKRHSQATIDKTAEGFGVFSTLDGIRQSTPGTSPQDFSGLSAAERALVADLEKAGRARSGIRGGSRKRGPGVDLGGVYADVQSAAIGLAAAVGKLPGVAGSASAAATARIGSPESFLNAATTDLDLTGKFGGFIDETTQMTEAIRAFGDASVFALNAFSDASINAFDSWASGASTFSEATQKILGATMKALGDEMITRAKFHAAAAIGSLASADFRGAGLHGLAAAGYLAGAGLARRLGGGSSAGASAGATPSVSGLGGAAAGGGSFSQTIVIGNQFSEADELSAANRTAEYVRRAKRIGGSGDYLEYG